MQPQLISPITEEAAKLADALIGKLGSPVADRLLEEFAVHAGGHAELVDAGDCGLCNARAAAGRIGGEAARHLSDAGWSLLAAATALLSPLAQHNASDENRVRQPPPNPSEPRSSGVARATRPGLWPG